MNELTGYTGENGELILSGSKQEMINAVNSLDLKGDFELGPCGCSSKGCTNYVLGIDTQDFGGSATIASVLLGIELDND